MAESDTQCLMIGATKPRLEENVYMKRSLEMKVEGRGGS